jgi:hypothetical protein
LALGPAASFGVIGPFAPALSGELGLRTARWRAGLGAQWLLPQRRALAPGSVRETLVTAAVRGCYAAWRGPADLRLELCSGLWLGSLSARADGFTRDASASELWLAWPIELTLAQSTGPIGWELIATAILPVRRRDFAIEGAGSAYRSAPIAALLCLRAVGLWPSSDSFGRGQ